MKTHAPPSLLEMPFPAAATNPLTQRAQEHTRDWAYRFRLVRGLEAVRRFRRLRVGYLGGRTHPYLPFEELALATDWLTWLFHLHDQVDDLPPGLVAATDRQLAAQITAVLQPGEQFADTPVSRTLANLWRRTTRMAPVRWQERFAADLVDHLGLLRQRVPVPNGSRQVPEVESYIAARRHSSGMFLALDMVEAAGHVDVPADLAASPEFQALREATNDVVSWTSDIASHARDIARGEVNNLAMVLQRQQRSPGAAIRHATELVNERIEDFLAAKQALPAACDRLTLDAADRAGLRRVVAGYEAWMRGSRDWSLGTERYLWIDDWSARTRASSPAQDRHRELATARSG
jgi:Terpene synthase family 2, C-terminal metal binding